MVVRTPLARIYVRHSWDSMRPASEESIFTVSFGMRMEFSTVKLDFSERAMGGRRKFHQVIMLLHE